MNRKTQSSYICNESKPLPTVFREYKTTYSTNDEKQRAKKSAMDIMRNEKRQMDDIRKNQSQFPERRGIDFFSIFRRQLEVPYDITDFKHTTITKLHDILHYGHVLPRCPIGGLVLQTPYDYKRKICVSNIEKSYIQSYQPDLTKQKGVTTNFDEYPYVFTKEWAPDYLEFNQLLWLTLAESNEKATIGTYYPTSNSAGNNINEWNALNCLKDKIEAHRYREETCRKFRYYIQYWEEWVYIPSEPNMYKSEETCVSQHDDCLFYVRKAETYISYCKAKDGREPFPPYDKEKDEYWKYRKPTGYEVLYKERRATDKHQRGLIFGYENDFTDAKRFVSLTDMSETLSRDDWMSQEVLSRVFATFPRLDVSLLIPEISEYKTRMNLVSDIMKAAPKFAPGNRYTDNFDLTYVRQHPHQNVQKWAWRLGAIMNAFNPCNPKYTTETQMYLGLFFGFLRSTLKSVPFEFHYDKSITESYRYTHFIVINNLLHCHDVKKRYKSWAAFKYSGIVYTDNEDLLLYKKMMELNHTCFHTNDKPLFSERDEIRFQNYLKIREAFIKYSDLESLGKENNLVHKEKDYSNPFDRDCHYYYSSYDHFTDFNKHANVNVLSILPSIYPKYNNVLRMTISEQNDNLSVYFANFKWDEEDNTTFENGTDKIWKCCFKNKKLENKAITIDFNHRGIYKINPTYGYYENCSTFVPDADIDELLSYVPKLVDAHIPFSISDVGLLTIYNQDNYDNVNDVSIAQFVYENIELFQNHDFFNTYSLFNNCEKGKPYEAFNLFVQDSLRNQKAIDIEDVKTLNADTVEGALTGFTELYKRLML